MRYVNLEWSCKSRISRTAVIGLVILSLLIISVAQSQPPSNRKKIKKFGSSLQRLEWNAEKNTAEMRADKTSAIADEGDVIRIETSLVSADLLVLDERGRNISGLKAEDFLIAEEGVAQTVGHFFNGDNVDVPRTIVLLIDYSGSQLPFLYNSVQAAKLLVDKLGPRDLMAIVTDDVELIQEFTNEKKKLKHKLDSLLERVTGKQGILGIVAGDFPRLGRSRQYSALMATLNEMFQEEDPRRIVIFQTDGDEAVYLRNPRVAVTIPPGLQGEALKTAEANMEIYQRYFLRNQTQFSLNDLYRAVEKARVTLYTVIPGVRLWGLPSEAQLQKGRPDQIAQTAGWMGHLSKHERARFKERLDKQNKKLDEGTIKMNLEIVAKQQAMVASVATISGGWADFLEEPEQADAIYSRIFSDINQRYIVGYYPTNKERDGKRRRIEFKVKGHPEYQVYGRLSYFAPEP
jgi:VWFA-related protein